jgi:hypothetical protein
MSYAKDLLTGIAQMISDTAIAVYKPAGAYDAADNAIVFGVWPQSPDRCIVLNYTPLVLATMIPMERGLLEAHIRGPAGDPFDAADTGAAIRDLIHGIRNTPFGTANVIQILHRNTVPLVQDANRRMEVVEQFDVDLDTPPTANRPDGGEW